MKVKKAHGKSSQPLSPALSGGEYIFVSGQVPVDENGNLVKGTIEEQTEQVLSNVAALLREAGSSLDLVVKTTVFLVNIKSNFDGMNRAYKRFFSGVMPARSTIGAELAVDALVEIEAIALPSDE